MFRTLAKPSREPWIVVAGRPWEAIKSLLQPKALLVPAILLFGALVRAAWLGRGGLGHTAGEAQNIAIAFAQTGAIANAFGPGSGLTAHLNPVPEIFAGSIYRLFGIESATSETILAGCAIFIAMASGYAMFRAFALLGVPLAWRIAALSIYALLPVNPELETVAFRIWEGGITVLLAAILLVGALVCEKASTIGWRQWASQSVIASLILFFNPAMGVAAFTMLGILLFRQSPMRRWPPLVAMSALALVLVLAPWTIRNSEAFGSFIPLRSNAGLELALANYQGAVDTADRRQAFVERLNEIHPLKSQQAFNRMLTYGNERNYARTLGSEAREWIVENPGSFLRLSIRHITQFYFPPKWFWTIDGESSIGNGVKQAIFWIISALGLTGAIAGLLFWRGGWLYLSAFALAPSVTYAVVQPVLRYHYLVYGILVFLAVETVRRCFSQRAAFFARLMGIQTMQLTEAELHAAGGEVGCCRALGQTASDWIDAHPWDFLTLSERRFIEFFLRPRWFWSPYSATPEHYGGLRQSVVWLAALGGLATLVAMAPFRRGYAYILAAVAGIEYPALRYRYPVSTLLVFRALDGAFRLFAYPRRQTPPARSAQRLATAPRTFETWPPSPR
jgi:hypothetical protein